jgi:hypothetical protein
MAWYFPGRNPHQLKNKAKKENKINPEKVDEAIRARRPIGEPNYSYDVFRADKV